MASASGIELVPTEKLNPMETTTYGTGELIKAALDQGVQEIIIGIGGSATVDGGVGMAMALGFQVLDAEGKSVGFGGKALARIAKVSAEGADPRLKKIAIKVACDVTNPLTGVKGAAAVFGPQKGATPEMVTILDTGLGRLGDAWIAAGMTKDVAQNGDGAAGGVGAALRIFMGAKMEGGALIVMRYAGFFDKLKTADLVITGEGMTDSQTAGGKLCSVVAQACREAGVPVALLSGGLGGDPTELLASFDYAVSISCGQTSLAAMLRDSRRDLRYAAANLTRAMKIIRK
ncbi:glycerate kinase [Treponema sp.]